MLELEDLPDRRQDVDPARTESRGRHALEPQQCELVERLPSQGAMVDKQQLLSRLKQGPGPGHGPDVRRVPQLLVDPPVVPLGDLCPEPDDRVVLALGGLDPPRSAGRPDVLVRSLPDNDGVRARREGGAVLDLAAADGLGEGTRLGHVDRRAPGEWTARLVLDWRQVS